MKSLLCTLCVSLAAIHAAPAAEPEWKPLFKPNDLSGWINVNCAPDTWTIKDGVIACTGKPTGALRTERQYENFELELEWRHMKPGGNAGIFIWASALPAAGVPFLRSIEVQVLDNGYDEKGKNEFYTTHGDVFPIHGATMTPMRPQTHKGDRCFPSEERSKSSPEWNHYRIVANNGSIRLSVNGKEVSGGDKCNWRKGYLGLESEGSPTEWRNLKIKELPATGATPEQSAPLAAGERKSQAITVNAQGSVLLNAIPVTLKELESRLASFKSKNPEFPVIVAGDSSAQYQGIMDVLDVVGRLGISEVGLVTQPPD